jgi:hypothetical protein
MATFQTRLKIEEWEEVMRMIKERINETANIIRRIG